MIVRWSGGEFDVRIEGGDRTVIVGRFEDFMEAVTEGGAVMAGYGAGLALAQRERWDRLTDARPTV